MFYIFLYGMSVEELGRYQMTQNDQKIPMDQFEYLKSSKCYTVKGIDDAELFKEIQHSIRVLGQQSYYEDMFSIVAAVLLLGNIRFDESTYGNDTPCSVMDQEGLKKLALLMKMNVEELS